MYNNLVGNTIFPIFVTSKLIIKNNTIMATKIYLVKEEYNNDGEIQNEVFPCISLEVAQRKMEERKKLLFGVGGHWSDYDMNSDGDDDVSIEQDTNSFQVEDLYDDYHCFLEIEEAEVYE